MRILGKLLKWILIGLALSLALVVGFVAVYTQTDSFRSFLREQVVSAAGNALQGDIGVGKIEGSVWSQLTLHDLTVRLDGETVAQVDEARIGYSLGSLLRKRLDVTQAALIRPVLIARQDEEGVWNVVEAFTPVPSQEPEEPPAEDGGGLPITISVPNVTIEDGRIEVTPHGEAAQTYRIEAFNLDASARIEPERTLAQLKELTANLGGEGIPPVRLVAAAEYDQAERTRIELERIDLEARASALHLQGQIEDLDTLEMTAQLDLKRLSSEEIRQFLPAWPLQPDVQGSLHVAGNRSDLDTELTIAAGEASIQATAWSDLSGEQLRFRADVALAGIAPKPLLGNEEFAGVVSGRIHAEGSSSHPSAIEANADLTGKDLSAPGAQLGDLHLTASMDDGVANVRGDLKGPGTARLDATVRIEEQRYEARLDMQGVNVGKAVPAAEAAGGSLNMNAWVQGSGFEPASMNLRAEMDVHESEVGPLAIDSGRFVGQVSEGQLDLETLALRASGTELTASGDVGLTGEQQVDLQVALNVPNAAPWLKLAEQDGSGSLRMDAAVRGSISALAIDGTVDADRLRVGTTELARLHADIDLTEVTTATPAGQVAVSLQGLNAGIEIASADLGVGLGSRDGAMTADVSLDAQTKEGYDQRLRAGVVSGEERIEVDLRDLSLQVPTGTWQLAQPARIVRAQEEIAIGDLRLLSGDQLIRVDGTFGRPGEQLDADVRNVTLGSFQTFAGESITELSGTLEADISLRGTAAAPEPSGEARLREGVIGIKDLGITARSINLVTRMDPEKIDLDLEAQAEDGSLRAWGAIRLLDYQPDNLDVRVDLNRWPVANTNQYKAKVNASVGASGPLTGPALVGDLTVVEASLRPDISLPGGGGPPPRDRTITVVRRDETMQAGDEPADEDEDAPDVEESELLKQTRLDLHVIIARNAWVKKDNSALELIGDLRIEKDHGDEDIALIGDIRVEHGWIYLYGRRFEPTQGVVTFTGGREIDPALDVVLESRVGEYQVETIVKGTASKPELSFESQPNLEDADILALLMFGRPINQLGEGEKTSLQQEATDFAAGYAAGKVSQQLGDALGIQVSELDVTNGRLGIGRYLNPKTYLSIIQSVAGGREVNLDYYLTPSWTARASTDSEGENAVDLFWRKKY